MTDRKKPIGGIALDHMTAKHIENKLQNIVVPGVSGKTATLTTAHLRPKAAPSARPTSSGSGTKKP